METGRIPSSTPFSGKAMMRVMVMVPHHRLDPRVGPLTELAEAAASLPGGSLASPVAPARSRLLSGGMIGLLLTDPRGPEGKRQTTRPRARLGVLSRLPPRVPNVEPKGKRQESTPKSTSTPKSKAPAQRHPPRTRRVLPDGLGRSRHPKLALPRHVGVVHAWLRGNRNQVILRGHAMLWNRAQSDRRTEP